MPGMLQPHSAYPPDAVPVARSVSGSQRHRRFQFQYYRRFTYQIKRARCTFDPSDYSLCRIRNIIKVTSRSVFSFSHSLNARIPRVQWHGDPQHKNAIPARGLMNGLFRNFASNKSIHAKTRGLSIKLCPPPVHQATRWTTSGRYRHTITAYVPDALQSRRPVQSRHRHGQFAPRHQRLNFAMTVIPSNAASCALLPSTGCAPGADASHTG